VDPTEPNWALAGELLLAVSGLWPTNPLTPEDAEKARALPKAWAEELERLLSGGDKTKAPRSPKIRYLATWKRLNDAEPDDADALTVLVEDKQIASAYKKARDNAFDYLTEAMRPVMIDDLQQTRLLEPSVGQQLLANELVATAGDPGRVVYSLRAGLVAADSVDLVREVFPATDALIQRLIGLELHRQRTRRATYRVPWSAEVVLRAYLGEPIGTAGPTASIAAEGPDGEQAQVAPEVPDIGIRRDRADTETRTDRVADLGP
jgi:hypothetical protein